MDKKFFLVGILSFVLVSLTARRVCLFVTVGSKRDTPQRVQKYVNHFNTVIIELSKMELQISFLI